MSESIERPYQDPHTRFAIEKNARFTLWRSMVDDSGLPEKVKQEFRKVLDERFEFQPKQIHGQSLEDFAYYTISILAGVVKRLERDTSVDMKELESVFENIREDVWALLRELRNNE